MILRVLGRTTERDEILQKDRDFSDCPLQDTGTGGQECGGSGTTTPAQTIVSGTDAGSYVVDQTTGGGAFNPLGTFTFSAGTGSVTLTSAGSMDALAATAAAEVTGGALDLTASAGGIRNRNGGQ